MSPNCAILSHAWLNSLPRSPGLVSNRVARSAANTPSNTCANTRTFPDDQGLTPNEVPLNYEIISYRQS